MKKLLTLGLGLIAFAGLAGCKKKDSITYDYNGKGVLVSAIEYGYNRDNKKELMYRLDKIYDENNNLCLEYKYAFNQDSKKFETIFKTINTFSPDNQILRSEYVDFEGTEIIEYSYQNGKLVSKSTTSNFLGRSKKLVAYYSYDEKDNIVSEEVYETSTSGYLIEYYYNSDNLLVQETKQLFMDKTNNFTGEWQLALMTNYTYDTKSNLVKKEIYDYVTDWRLYNTYEYEYDENNNLVKETYSLQLYTDGAKYEHSYDSNNNRIETIDYYDTKNGWAFFKKHVYEYDKDNKLVKENRYNEDNSLSGYTETKYTYFE